MISNLWIIGFGIGALIVVVVVILLAGIIFQTKRIIKLANIALSEVKKIESNTMSIWKLNQTNAHTEWMGTSETRNSRKSVWLFL